MTHARGDIRIGIGGWTYAPWRGTFYPSDLPRTRELEFAASRLTTIEVNATYYGNQKPATFARWASVAPATFRFALKAPRAVVARKRLDEAGEAIERFTGSGIVELGDRLGPLLWQLPAYKRYEADEFAAFLSLLCDRVAGQRLRHAVELRHHSFACVEVVARCRKAGVAIVVGDDPATPTMADATADFVYLRLQRGCDDIETGYTHAALDRWRDRVRQCAAGMAPDGLSRVSESGDRSYTPRDVFAYFIRAGKRRAPQAAMALQADL
ncbi:DUF72 domain-containing protein [Salinisphaera sp. T31B1]|uniref:DUF72 domain-containing protein n=1 Tax=Salinisphaera sp. T31B1 TaxID=727963 RepID=UPI00333EC54B